MFQTSCLLPTEKNTFVMGPNCSEELKDGLKSGAISFVEGIYYLESSGSGELKVNMQNLLPLMDAIKETQCTTPIYTLSTGKPLKLIPTPEVLASSRISNVTVWDHEKIGKDRRVEGVVSGEGGLTWQAMCFDFSNFGNGQNFGMSVLDFLTLESLQTLVPDKALDWKSVEMLLKLKCTTTEFVIQAIVKGLAAVVLPAKVSSSDKASLKAFDFNIQKLGAIKIPDAAGISSFKASYEIGEGKHWFKGEGLHEAPIFVDTLEELVKAANDYIFWSVSMVKSFDSTVKALCNALHINPIFFREVGNGTAYPLGALGEDIGTNSMANMIGYLMRILTQPEFKTLMTELYINRGVKVGEVAAHVRGKSFYVDNTFGGGFSNQLGPMTSEVEIGGERVVFYNALGHGYSLAGQVLASSQGDEEEIKEAIEDGFVYIFSRIVNAAG